MPTPSTAISAYTKTSERGSNDRDREYRLFAIVTAKLERARDLARDHAGETDIETIAAVHDAAGHNRNLWVALLADLVDPGNRLPEPLKKALINLALWVQHKTPEVIASRAGFDDLIRVNRDVMEGLRPSAPPL